MTQRLIRMTMPLGVSALALTLVACGANSSTSSTTAIGGSTTEAVAPTASTSGPGTPATGAGTHSGIPATTQLHTGSPAVGAPMVTVTETEFKLAFSTSSFQPGSYTFVAVNRGKVAHALAMSGPGIQKSTGTIPPGQSARFTVTLQAGGTTSTAPSPATRRSG